jgi:hypothetical protein
MLSATIAVDRVTSQEIAPMATTVEEVIVAVTEEEVVRLAKVDRPKEEVAEIEVTAERTVARRSSAKVFASSASKRVI